ncbi:diguanylate cyclase (GGDEF) domain-containing protein [Microbulbifer yueqingensis]|uniref:diguanylate cyclase n=1 Tax=Microbulbifer yueqingensis TaxID=658219 RepID=A0A1G8Y0G8_9GAMM|nr:diguanylate cyclase (GGDEF) domain-containing protein [Microbulbifer yueqingensis]
MRVAGILWGIFLFCLALDGQAEPLTVAPGQQSVSLAPHLRLLEDRDGSLTFDELRHAAEGLRPWNEKSANFGYTSSTYWVAFTLRNPSGQALPLLIRQDYPLIDFLEFWEPREGGGWRHVATGDRRPFSSRPLALREFVFPVTLPPASERTYYMRFATQGAMNIGLSVSSEVSLISHLTLEQFLLGVYYGGFLVLVIYNLLLFLAVRDRAYGFYMGYALSYSLYFGALNGVSFQFVWPDNPWLANESLLVLLGLSIIFGIQFARTICSGRQLAPRVDRVAGLLLYLTIALTVIAPFVGYRLMVTTLTVQALLASVLMLILGAVSLWRGSIPARYFMVGWATFLASIIVYVLKTFGWLPHNPYTHNAFQVAALIEMVLLSLALGARVREIRRRGFTDELSGLCNRRFFEQRLPREFSQVNRSGSPLSLLFMDLDHFKAINDRYGHARGDEAIRAVGQLILQQTRRPVVACRYGGEEFAVLLPQTNAAQAEVLAGRLLQKVKELGLFDLPMTISIGVATYDGHNFDSAMQLFDAADRALYRAKQQGRDRVQMSLAGAEALGLS